MYKFVVLGGGTAGWLTALNMNKHMPYSEVTVIASSEIGILGAGEGTTPHFMDMLKSLDIKEEEFFEHCKATRKNSIKFFNWNGDGKEYDHPFWDNKYALHFDARLTAEYLRSVAVSRGVRYIDDKVTSINSNKDESIKSLTLSSGEEVVTDFLFDCSGLKRMIIGEHYNSEWCSYQNHLPAKRAIPFFLPRDENDTQDYTGAFAMKNGWVWKIPVQGRFGCGYVFDSDFCTDEEAIAEIKELFGEVEIPTKFDFKAGCYKTTWVKNCIAIGLASGFTEPMEATSIWIQVQSLLVAIQLLPRYIRNGDLTAKYYNEAIQEMNNNIMIFLHLHYLTKRNDTEFWKTFTQKNSTPDYLLKIRDIINERPLEKSDFKDMNDTTPTFDLNSWLAVGQGVGYFG
jgi:tryptophan halogenase